MEPNHHLQRLKKRAGVELCLETGKLGIGVTLLVLIILVNHNTYSLLKCVADQMASLTALPLEQGEECIDQRGEAVSLRLCYNNASTSTLYVYAWHRRLTVMLQTPKLENIAEWLTNCANGHCSAIASTDCSRLVKSTFDGTPVEMCFDGEGYLLYASIDGFFFSTNDTKALIAFLR